MKKVLVITGPPASGKTTLKNMMLSCRQIPFISRDDIKELLFDTIGAGEVKLSKKQGSASYEILFHTYEQLMCSDNITLGIEGNFNRKLHGAKFNALITNLDDIETLQFVVIATPQILYERGAERHRNNRKKGHHWEKKTRKRFEQEVLPQMEPLELPGKTMTIDTSASDTSAMDEALAAYLDFTSKS